MKKLRIWWIPQVPMNPFHWRVNSVLEAKNMLDMLGAYDQFEFENKVKPDYSNTGGLQEFSEEEQDWFDYEDEEGRCIDEIEIEELR
jgi:hypothetical protein